MRIIGFEPQEQDTTVTRIDVWYDHGEFKTWVITAFNDLGDQVGESDYYHFKVMAVAAAYNLRDELAEKSGVVAEVEVTKRKIGVN